MRPAESSSVVINPVYKRVAKAVLDNIKNLPQCNKQLIEKALLTYQSDPIASLTQIRTDQATKQFFDQHMLEFNCWNESFAKTVEILNKRREVEGVDILEKIISIQPKIKSKTPHSSYFTNLMIYAKKQLKLDDEFARKWKQQKMKLREQKEQKVKQSERQKAQRQQERSKQQQKKDTQKQQLAKQRVDSIQQKPAIAQITNPQLQKQRSSTQSKQQVAIREREKKAQQKLKEIEKMKLDHHIKFKRNKDLRLSNILKYLDQRKQFTYATKDAVAKEILAYLEKFMRDKMEKIIKVTKMRYPGYVSEDAGDQFRMYSNKSNLIQVKHASMLPQTQLKILKVKYPSKLQSYLKLRIQEQRLEQKLKAELKQKMELDKKTDKLIQNYIISDQKQNFTEFERDQGPKTRQRIFVLPQVIQFVIEADPWFQDMFIMDRTFYK